MKLYSQKVTATVEERGIAITSFVLQLFLLLFLINFAFLVEIDLLRSTNDEINNLQDKNSLQTCSTFFLGHIVGNTKLNAITNHTWHNDFTSTTASLKNSLKDKNVLQNIHPSSIVVETLDYKVPVFVRKKTNGPFIFTSKHFQFLKEKPGPFFLLISPWTTSLTKSDWVNSYSTINDGNIVNVNLDLDLKILSHLRTRENGLYDNKVSPHQHWLLPLSNYGIIYMNKNNVLEYFSLLKNDKQPICRNIISFTRIDNICTIKSAFEKKNALRFPCENANYTENEIMETLSKWH